ncbi:MAG: GAP family protein [Ilumatobacteraceae bacterium]
MGPLVIEVALLGLLSGLDPLAFVAVLVVSAQHRRNGLAFVTGWLLTLSVLSIAPATILHSRPRHGQPTHRTLRAALLLGLGIILIALAVRSRWVGRHHDPDEVPRWYARLKRVGFKTSFLTGLLLPSFPAAIAAGASTFRSDIAVSGKAIAIIVFVIVSSITVVVPAVLLYAAPSTGPALIRINNRVFRERHDITFWVLGAIGLFLVVRSTLHLA